jgi:NAD(P)-dependent dehydrogenase (short-subunit alcohol dehydrogenase family)
MTLADKVALVTGAGRGIGESIAKIMADKGARVGLLDIQQDTAQSLIQKITAAGGTALALVADVSDPAQVDAAVKRLVRELGPPDILVNNAAAPAEWVPLHETTAKIQHEELSTLLGAINCSRAVLPAMIEKKWGRIVNISSIAGRHGSPGRTIYSAAKGGIDGLTRGLAREVGCHNITVNSVSPGATETPRFKARSREIRDEMARAIALPRFAEPEDLANAVAFLCSDQAEYISGTILDVDGGFSGFDPVH